LGTSRLDSRRIYLAPPMTVMQRSYGRSIVRRCDDYASDVDVLVLCPFGLRTYWQDFMERYGADKRVPRHGCGRWSNGGIILRL
jgi:hypothetical protein